VDKEHVSILFHRRKPKTGGQKMVSNNLKGTPSKKHRVSQVFKISCVNVLALVVFVAALGFYTNKQVSRIEEKIQVQSQLSNVSTWLKYNKLKLKPAFCAETFGHSFVKQQANKVDGAGVEHAIPDAFYMECRLCGLSGYAYDGKFLTKEQLVAALKEKE